MKITTVNGRKVIDYQARNITVYLENGDHFDTAIHAEVDQIVKMYLEKPVPMYYGEDPTMLRARSIVFHGEPYRKRFPDSDCRERLMKIWNLTDATMKKAGYKFKTRVCCEIIPDRFNHESYRESYAYFPSGIFERSNERKTK